MNQESIKLMLFSYNNISIKDFRLSFEDCTFNEDIYNYYMSGEKKLMFQKGDKVDCIVIEKTCDLRDKEVSYAQLYVWKGDEDYHICHLYDFQSDNEGDYDKVDIKIYY